MPYRAGFLHSRDERALLGLRIASPTAYAQTWHENSKYRYARRRITFRSPKSGLIARLGCDMRCVSDPSPPIRIFLLLWCPVQDHKGHQGSCCINEASTSSSVRHDCPNPHTTSPIASSDAIWSLHELCGGVRSTDCSFFSGTPSIGNRSLWDGSSMCSLFGRLHLQGWPVTSYEIKAQGCLHRVPSHLETEDILFSFP